MFRNYREKLVTHLRKNPLHPLQKCVVGIVFLIAGLTFVQVGLLEHVQRHAQIMLSSVLPGVIVELTNEERLDKAVPTLRHNTLLDETARRKAQDMVENEYFAHDSPEGVEPWHWFDEVGYNYVHAGENLAIYFDESEEVVEAWMESPLHKQNILKNEYTEIGVAAIEGTYKGYDTVFVVQHFGTPAQPTPKDDRVVTVAENITSQDEGTELPVMSTPKPAVNTVTVQSTPETKIANEVQGTSDTEAKSVTEKVVAPVTAYPAETLTYAETHNDLSLYLFDHDATTTSNVPAYTNPTSVSIDKTYIPSGPTATTQDILAYLYYTLIGFGVLGAVASTSIAVRNKHPMQLYYGLFLLILLFGASTLHGIFV
jgi:hypothetical protein